MLLERNRSCTSPSGIYRIDRYSIYDCHGQPRLPGRRPREVPHRGLISCEAGGDGLATGSAGVIHGMRTYLLQDDDGQTLETHSISAGLDYPGVGPEHS